MSRSSDGEGRLARAARVTATERPESTVTWANWVFGGVLVLIVLGLPGAGLYDTGWLGEEEFARGEVASVAHGEASTKVLLENGAQVRFRGVQPIERGTRIVITCTRSRLFGELGHFRWRPER